MMSFSTFMIEHLDNPPQLNDEQWRAMRKAYQAAVETSKQLMRLATRFEFPNGLSLENHEGLWIINGGKGKGHACFWSEDDRCWYWKPPPIRDGLRHEADVAIEAEFKRKTRYTLDVAAELAEYLDKEEGEVHGVTFDLK